MKIVSMGEDERRRWLVDANILVALFSNGHGTSVNQHVLHREKRYVPSAAGSLAFRRSSSRSTTAFDLAVAVLSLAAPGGAESLRRPGACTRCSRGDVGDPRVTPTKISNTSSPISCAMLRRFSRRS